MPGEAIQRVIGGVQYTMKPLGGVSSTHVFARIGRPLTELIRSKDRESFQAHAADAAKDLLSRPDDLVFLATEFAKETTYGLEDPLRPGSVRQVQVPDVQEYFRGRFMDMCELAQWGVEVNFGDFLGVLRGLFREAQGSSSTSPTPSTGGTGGSSPASV